MGLGALALALLAGCNNSPFPHGAERENALYMAFRERSPRYLDPTSSYSAPESSFVYEISEPLYGYHALKRPYALIPRAAAALAKPYYLDAQGQRLPDDAPDEQIAEAVYDIPLRPDLKWSPHPAFAKDAGGNHLYHHLKLGELGDKRSPFEFKQLATRAVVAEDFVYALKRHASPRIEAPLAAVFSEHVLGLKDYMALLKRESDRQLAGLPGNLADKPFLDLRRWPLAGAEAVNDHLLRIRLKGRYPQWQYWLATNFTAAIPWEVDAFYAQPGMAAHSLTWNQWPVGSGPFMMTEYVQDRRHVMSRNPNYHADSFPCDGSPGDAEAGLLADCGQRLPFVDKVVAINVKEQVPIKELFKQGYLDLPEMDRADWGVNLAVDRDDSDEVRRFYEERGFRLPMMVDISNWYLGFNWLDPVVGRGDTPEQQRRNRALRQAISIAIDWEEGYGRIFRDKGGDAAHGPIPPGVFGSREGQPGEYNPVTHRLVNGRVVRRPLEDALGLMAEAGYPGGRDAKTGRPLVLNYDFQRVVTPELKAENDWMTRQFAKLGIQLDIRATDFNQFQEKILKGKHQIFWWGWFADYPDAENFLFLLYGPNSKSLHEGENTANYANPEFDRLFRRLQSLEDGPEKASLMARMNDIVRQDAPWAFGYWSYSAVAFQHWVHNGKPGVVVRDRARYLRVDVDERARRIAEWNRPVWWPLLLLAAGGLVILVATRRAWHAREMATAVATRGEGA
ncbi:ABC transporter substrate-binding protein [Pelomonas aquatica]|jgi:ABC-type transport system substrate-binding protein|uniref:Peptide ABC transporter substrate-binding protein n=2 Tax=Pelomonas aquatica TaxID=431058 RepID=A0A9X4R3L4_9BURK|nr:ABC transporter substrate-binding protein [Pelomonas aquatica]MCY4753837.1 ABC transporter substrate-binding protein [Pelomonas aquatica]MDG0861164.1 peptide ABC transporter substrate-binding protein [Pelomonas aquatica]